MSKRASQSWERTEIWERIVALAGEGGPVAAALRSSLPDVANVLAHAETAPQSFTLHDAEHSWQVAQRMWELTPPDVRDELSACELGLLLLAAYLHDIGMTPRHGLVAAHHRLLVDGSEPALPEPARQAFQAWLDEEHPGCEAAPPEQRPGWEELCAIETLVASYVRHRHVDWSEEWIAEHLQLEIDGYPQAQEDLAMLCASHQEGLDALIEARFDPRFLRDGSVVHLRYLAALLRVADVLDVDPERTPAIVFQHRDVEASSVVHWHKDHELAIGVEQDGGVIAEAQPRSAAMHRAIEQTVDQIEAELRLVQSLAATKPFQSAPPRTRTLPHRWALDPIVHRRIEPKDGAYEYVDGAFRPNTAKLLEILGAVELYGEHLSALRELLQNAFDAVRERMTWQRLRHAGDAKLLGAHLDGHEVRIELTQDAEDRHWLVCTDSGAGMTKRVLTERLLVSGSGPSAELLELRRRAQQAGVPFERTGRFGVGVLSYFMLADRIELQTGRCEEASSGDGSWSFVTDGVGSFGELRRLSEQVVGTRVALRLRRDLIDEGIETFWDELTTYLDGQLHVLPCRTRVLADGLGATRTFPAGWAHPKWVVHELAPRASEDAEASSALVDWSTRQREEAQRTIDRLREQVPRCLRWREVEDQLPDGLGRFRFGLPYYDLDGEMSLAFLDVAERLGDGRLRLRRIGASVSYRPSLSTVHSWLGMHVMARARAGLALSDWASVRIDWTSDEAGRLRVSRNELQLSSAGVAAVRHVSHRVMATLAELVHEHEDSCFHALNSRLALTWVRSEAIEMRAAGDRWLTWETRDTDGGVDPVWAPIRFPVIDTGGSAAKRMLRAEEGLVARLPVVNQLRIRFGDASPGPGASWPSMTLPPDRIVLDDRGAVHRLWTSAGDSEPSTHPLGVAAQLPAQLAAVLGIRWAPGGWMTNAGHAFAATIDAELWKWAMSLTRDHDPVALRERILGSPEAARAWLLRFAMMASGSGSRDVELMWSDLAQKAPDFQEALWARAFDGDRAAPVMVVEQVTRDGAGGLTILRPGGVEIEALNTSATWRELTESLGPEFRLTEVRARRED
ncbi:MAG: hypothetical protein WBC33_01215 [Conexibacter sp.]